MSDLYVIVEALSSDDLIQRVNQRFILGFKPSGGVTVVLNMHKGLVFYQAMIKEEK